MSDKAYTQYLQN